METHQKHQLETVESLYAKPVSIDQPSGNTAVKPEVKTHRTWYISKDVLAEQRKERIHCHMN